MDGLVNDIRFAIRSLSKSPGLVAVAVATLGLGIGANAVIFTSVNAFLYRPMPVKAPEQLVVLASRDKEADFPHGLSYPDFLDYRRAHQFSGTIAYVPLPVNFSAGRQPERVWIEAVSENYFDMLGVQAVLGRTFRPDEERAPVVVLGHGFWKRRFAQDPNIVGRKISLNGHPFTIIGIAPPEFYGAVSWLTAEAFAPIRLFGQLNPGRGDTLDHRDAHFARVMARLKPGVSLERARSEVNTLAGNLQRQYPETNRQVSMLLMPETDSRPDPSISTNIPRYASFGEIIVGLLLVIACANIANLLLVRAIRRGQEIAIRSALGATRARLARFLFIDSLLLSLAGGAIGLLLMSWFSDLMATVRPPMDFPFRNNISPDARVFVFAVAVTFLTAALCGLIPILQLSRVNLNPMLKRSVEALSGRGPGRRPLSSLLIIGQVAMSLMLLIACGLFIRGIQNAQHVNFGFRTRNLQLFSIDLGRQNYEPARGKEFARVLLERVRATPGVENATLAKYIPLWEQSMRGAYPDEQPPTDAAKPPAVLWNVVALDYFQTMAIPFVRGRDFNAKDRDDLSSPPVAVVNETLARRFWPGREAIGRGVRLDGSHDPVQVIGVVRDAKYMFLTEEPQPCLYLPLSQRYDSPLTLLVHTSSDPQAIVPLVREHIRGLDPELPVYDVKSMERHLRGGYAIGSAQFATQLSGTFGILGLAMSVIGIYGVVSHSVSRRTREIGIRIALGAERRSVLALVIKEAMILVAIGIGIGMIGALGFTRLLTNVLFGVSPTDPLTFFVLTTALGAAALAACYFPGRRAMGADPMEALRYE